MKNLRIQFFLFFLWPFYSVAQYDTIGAPSGYTIAELRSVTSMVLDSNENVWVGFGKMGLAKYDWTAWTVFDSLNSGLLKNNVLSLACNDSGIWIGTDTGLYLFHSPFWTRFSVANSDLISDTVPHLYSTGGHDLYQYSQLGISHFNGSTWENYNTSNSGLVNDTVQCMIRDSMGVLWIGTKNGLSNFNGSVWQNYTTSNSMLPDNNISSIAEDGNHVIWVGLKTKGLYFISGNEFKPVRDYVSSFFQFPQDVRPLLKLKDGSLIFSGANYNFQVKSNPIEVKVINRYSFKIDTLNPVVVDSQNRILEFFKYMHPAALYRLDSLSEIQQETIPSFYNELNINQVRCGICNYNMCHWDQIGNARYEVPKNSFHNAVFSSSLWIGGMDPTEKLHLAAHTYRQSGTDFWPGPLDTLNGTVDSATVTQYDSLWKVDHHTLDEFRTQYALGNVTNGSYEIPNEILYWPARGNGNYSRHMAPYVDVNGDGIYNPIDGDYPKIKGDQMLWWVFNDNADTHTHTNGIPMGIEVQAQAYAYSCPFIPDSSQAINYATFYSYEFFNRSDTDYHNVFIGLYVDADLGNYLDDFTGCNIDNDIGFVYNGDNNDDGLSGYGINPPIISAAILKGPLADTNDLLDNNHNGVVDEQLEQCMMNHFLYYNNTNSACLGNPNDALEYYFYLQSLNRCGNPFTYGGNGNGGGIGGTNIPTNYFFSGTPYDTGWTESGAGFQPDDRRFLMSSGPFTLQKGRSTTLDYALIYTRDESAPNGLNTSIAKNIADVQRIKRWFDTDSFPCNNSSIGINEPGQNEMEFSVYPNPAKDMLSVNRYSFSETAVVELYDVLGQKIISYLFPAGRKELRLSTAQLQPGIYFLKLREKNLSVTKKVIIAR